MSRIKRIWFGLGEKIVGCRKIGREMIDFFGGRRQKIEGSATVKTETNDALWEDIMRLRNRRMG